VGPLADQLVFPGGCATGLLITDVAASPVPITQDIDVITAVERFGEPLRQNLAHRFASLLQDGAFIVALPGHMPPDVSSPARLPLAEERIRVIVGGIG